MGILSIVMFFLKNIYRLVFVGIFLIADIWSNYFELNNLTVLHKKT